MTAPTFDSAHAVRFNLPRGAVLAGAHDERLLLVPSSIMEELVRTAPPEAIDGLARSLGAAVGRRAATRFDSVQNVSVEAFVTQLAGEAALAGIGALTVERWGRAMVVALVDCPLPDPLLAPLVASAVSAASGRSADGTLLSRDERTARVLVSSERVVERVRAWIAAGTPWAEALARAQGAKA